MRKRRPRQPLAQRRAWSPRPPPPSPPSRPHSPAGSVTTATNPWFFAAARISAGPPISIFSMQSSRPAPGPPSPQTDRGSPPRDRSRRSHGSSIAFAMLGQIPPRQNAAMDLRMQRLNPPIHHLRKAGVPRPPRAPALPPPAAPWPIPPVEIISTPLCRQKPPELHQPRLVRNRNQRPLDRLLGHDGPPAMSSPSPLAEGAGATGSGAGRRAESAAKPSYRRPLASATLTPRTPPLSPESRLSDPSDMPTGTRSSH